MRLNYSILTLALLFAGCTAEQPLNQTKSNASSSTNGIAKTNQEEVAPTEPQHSEIVDFFAHLPADDREVLREWLTGKGHLRPAVEEIDNPMIRKRHGRDKESIDQYNGHMRMLREAVGEKGYQYYSSGDMNGDGKRDFAVLLVDTRKRDDDTDRFGLAIFNGPLKKGIAASYYESKLSGISNSYIVFDGISENRLFLGKFESDVYCATYYPKGKSYFFKDCIDE